MIIKPGALVRIKHGKKVTAWVSTAESNKFYSEALVPGVVFLYLTDQGEAVTTLNPYMPEHAHKVLCGDRLVWLQCDINDFDVLPFQRNINVNNEEIAGKRI